MSNSFFFADDLEWRVFPYQIVGGVIVLAMALVLLAAVSYQCTATWRWIRGKTCRDLTETEDCLAKQTSICISHSLPDLQTEPLTQEYVQEHKDSIKKVIHFFYSYDYLLNTPTYIF